MVYFEEVVEVIEVLLIWPLTCLVEYGLDYIVTICIKH